MQIEWAKNGAGVRYQAIVLLETDLAASWRLLSTTEGLRSWFPELSVAEFKVGGSLAFNSTNTEQIAMPIYQLQQESELGFGWARDRVHFALSEETRDGTTKLIFTEEVQNVTSHTPRDLAGWYMCLQRMQQVSRGEDTTFDQALFDRLFEEYQAKLQK